MAEIKLSNNKIIEILDNEVQSNKVIIFHHGTPGDASFWQPWLDTSAAIGMRAISYSRAGYGKSARNLGRTVFSNNYDISEILDSLKISRFISIGWSGGGPHALATTCDVRNLGAICLAGVGEYGAADLNFLEGMGQENHDEFGKESVSNKSYVGIGLSFLDAGWTYDNLAGLALDAAGAKTNDQIVSLLWTNVIGSKPTAADKQPFIALLENGMSSGALAHLAADTSLNATNINLVGLAQTGIEYIPVG